MNTNSNITGNDHRQARLDPLTDSMTPSHGSMAAASRDQSAQTQSFGLGDSVVVVWPHFNIGSDGRAYV